MDEQPPFSRYEICRNSGCSKICQGTNPWLIPHTCYIVGYKWQGVEPEPMAVDQHGEPIKGLCDMWSAGVVRRPRTKQLGPRGRLIQWELFDVGCCWSFSTCVPRIFYNFWMVWLVWLCLIGMIGMMATRHVATISVLSGPVPFARGPQPFQPSSEAIDPGSSRPGHGQKWGTHRNPKWVPGAQLSSQLAIASRHHQIHARDSFGIIINQFSGLFFGLNSLMLQQCCRRVLPVYQFTKISLDLHALLDIALKECRHAFRTSGLCCCQTGSSSSCFSLIISKAKAFTRRPDAHFQNWMGFNHKSIWYLFGFVLPRLVGFGGFSAGTLSSEP